MNCFLIGIVLTHAHEYKVTETIQTMCASKNPALFSANYVNGSARTHNIFMASILQLRIYVGGSTAEICRISPSSHIYRQEHQCSALCSQPGICMIETTPQSIETGRHKTFQYTKVSEGRSIL